MRKGRFIISLDEVENFESKPESLLDFLKNSNIIAPKWANFLFCYLRSDQTLDITLFEEMVDYFTWYSKVMLKRNNRSSILVTYSKKDVDCIIYVPPTLISVNLKSKLR